MAKINLVDNVMVFSRAMQGTTRLTTNFQVYEFGCNDGSDTIVIHPFIPIICQMVRNKFNMPFVPNCGYRTPSHNKAIGGVAYSNHIYGKAVDIPAKNGVTPKQLYDFVDTLFGNWGEIGIYSWGIHVGIQETKERFTDKSYTG